MIGQNEHFLGRGKKDYFEGWYFRHGGELPFSFIAGISHHTADPHSFIQYIDCERSYIFRFPLEEFSFDQHDMTVKIAQNYFSRSGLKVDLQADDMQIGAELCYHEMVRFDKTIWAPSVMGPFSYFPLHCKHAVISMRHLCSGLLHVNGDNYAHPSIVGYIEKDFGKRFPQNYVWLHAATEEISVMAAVAQPILPGGMRGFLCVVLFHGKQYNLSLYTGAKLEVLQTDENGMRLCIRRGKIRLDLEVQTNAHSKWLLAPAEGGEMTRKIEENLRASVAGSFASDKKEANFSCFCAYEAAGEHFGNPRS